MAKQRPRWGWTSAGIAGQTGMPSGDTLEGAAFFVGVTDPEGKQRLFAAITRAARFYFTETEAARNSPAPREIQAAIHDLNKRAYALHLYLGQIDEKTKGVLRRVTYEELEQVATEAGLNPNTATEEQLRKLKSGVAHYNDIIHDARQALAALRSLLDAASRTHNVKRGRLVKQADRAFVEILVRAWGEARGEAPQREDMYPDDDEYLGDCHRFIWEIAEGCNVKISEHTIAHLIRSSNERPHGKK